MRLGAISSFGMTLIMAVAVAAPAAADSGGGGGVAAPSGNPPPSSQPPSSQPPPPNSTPGDPYAAPGSPSPTDPTGGSAYGTAPTALPQMVVPGTVAKVVNGLAAAPADAPPAVQDAIWAANAIIGKPYVYGGGHQAFTASGYDCSGTVSYALHGGFLLAAPMDSTEFESFGLAGRGQWISIYSNPGHAYMNIAGIRLDTSSAGDPSGKQGPRWRPLRRSNRGYRVRHPTGL